MTRPRAGTTLVEFLIFFAIAVVVLGVAWSMLGSSTRLGRRAVENVTLQGQVRNVIEYMTRDVTAAYLIDEPNGTSPVPHDKLVVYRYAAKDARRRLGLNEATIQPNTGLPGSTYPIGNMTDGSVHKLVMTRVTYAYDSTKKEVTRETVAGTLAAVAPDSSQGNPRMIVAYEFTPLGSAGSRPRVLGRNVTRFEIVPAGYDPTVIDAKTGRGRLLDTKSLPALPVGAHQPQATPADGPKSDRTAMVVVRIRAEFDKGDNVKKAEDTSTELITKIWSYPKLYDHVHRPYFSSVDHDLRY